MKAALISLAGLIMTSCSYYREIQMNMVDVQLVKIDTIQRYPDIEQAILTWRSSENINYITMEPLSHVYALGSHMLVMVKR